MPINKQIFLPVMGLSCNSHCIMCSVASKKHDEKEGTTEQIINDIIRGRKEGYDRIEFTGGEPTVRKDIAILIKKAKDLGYSDIGISTNGILLNDKKLLDKLIKNGLTNITFSLHAHNAHLYEIISQTPGVFDKILKAIKLATQYRDIYVSVVTVILKQNYKYIFEIGKLINSLGVSCWDITDLIPDGRARENYKNLYISRKQLSNALLKIKPLLKNFQSIVFFAMAPCVVPPEILYHEKVSLFTAKQKVDVEKPLRYNQNNDDNDKDKTYSPQEYISSCKQCTFRFQCNGVWKAYIQIKEKSKTDKEISQLLKKYKYYES